METWKIYIRLQIELKQIARRMRVYERNCHYTHEHMISEEQQIVNSTKCNLHGIN